MITTAKNSWQSDLKLIDFNISSLLKPCSVRFKIFTLPQSLIDRNLGVLGSLDQKNLKVQLKKVFCL
jgi:mRNA interferase MazF